MSGSLSRPAIMAWRKAERQRLIEARLAVDPRERQRRTVAIAANLSRRIGAPAGRLASLYWPFRGEPDLRPWMAEFGALGGRSALPVVVEKNAPLVFRVWQRGDPLVRGVWNILMPAEGPAVFPDIVIAPLVGHDAAGYRLGYGGGFFDRTLAAMPGRPLAIGVGYADAALATIHPLPHDIPMDAIVTEEGILEGAGRGV